MLTSIGRNEIGRDGRSAGHYQSLSVAITAKSHHPSPQVYPALRTSHTHIMPQTQTVAQSILAFSLQGSANSISSSAWTACKPPQANSLSRATHLPSPGPAQSHLPLPQPLPASASSSHSFLFLLHLCLLRSINPPPLALLSSLDSIVSAG